MTSIFVLLTTLSVCAPAPTLRNPNAEPDGDDVTVLNTKDCEIPVMIRADAVEKIAKLHLHVSEDEGKTWRVAQSVPPEAKEFTFSAPRPGMYWLRVQVAFKDGNVEPSVIKGKTADQKLRYKPDASTVSTAPTR